MSWANCASPVALTKVVVEPGNSPYTFDTNSERYDYEGETLSNNASILHAQTIRGTRSEAKERTREGPSFVSGVLAIPVDVAALDLWLPRILGANASGTTFALAETLPYFGVLADLGGNTHEFKNCLVQRAIFRGEAYNGDGIPRPLTLELHIIGSEEATATTFPNVSLSTAANTSPLMLEDGVVTLLSTARSVMKFAITVDNMIIPRWSTGSLFPTCFIPGGRRVNVQMITPYSSNETDLYGQTPSGSAATMAFTNGNTSVTFSMPALSFPRRTPHAVGRGEVVLHLNGTARKSGSTAELTVVNDSTP